MQTPNNPEHEKIYTVSRLNNEVRFLLEDTFPFIWVEGEISNFAAPHSGHWYFSLKDAAAQVRCAMFRGSQRKLAFIPKDGTHVLIKARVSLYENRGEFQLIAEEMEERGEGKLQRAFEILKKKLEAAGLFNREHKLPLPALPRQMGVITSATGAAIRDILTVLRRRYPSVPVIIYPTLVQGAAAAPAIANAIQTADRRRECDVLILARGGGSLEDLWPFNEEIVAHAIYQCTIPIISGIGHEVGFTIADFVADLRAPTPSAAAEIAVPDNSELLQALSRQRLSITRCMQRQLSVNKQQLFWVQKHLDQQHPKRRLMEKMQRLDFCELALIQLQTRLISNWQAKLKDLDIKLHRQTSIHQINLLKNQVAQYYQRLNQLIAENINRQQAMLANAASKLDALSPLATLKRGYAIATDKNHHVVRSVNEVKIDDTIYLQLQKDSLECIVKSIQHSKEQETKLYDKI